MSELEIRLVYSIQSERQDNEMVEKIVWNNLITEYVARLINQELQVQVIGLYGTKKTVQSYLKEKTQCKIKFEDDIKKWKKRGMLCWVQHNSIYYFQFIAHDEYFTKSIFEETSEIIVYRYLRDLCHKIILLPSKKILSGWNDLKNHFYEDQEARVQDFQIQKIQETELVIKQIKASSEDRLKIPIQNFAPGSDDIRCQQLEQTSQEQILMTQSEMNFMFKELLNNNKKSKKYDFDDQYSIKIQKEIAGLRQQFSQSLEHEFELLNQSFRQILQKQGMFSKNVLKENNSLFDHLHLILFNMFREMLDLDKINLLDNRLIKERTLSLLQEDQINNVVQNNLKDLDNLIQEYSKEFQNIYKNGKFQISQLAAQFRENLKIKLKELSSESDIFIDISLYEFRYIISKDNNTEPQCIIEDVKTKKIFISSYIQQEKGQIIKIQYFCIQANQKYNMLVLSNQTNLQQIQYFWMNSQANKSQQIIKLNQVAGKPLLFYYDTQEQTMYVFNTQIGITIFQYNEEREQLKSERNIVSHFDDIIIDICYLKYYECFILLSKQQKLLKWSIDSKEIHLLKLEPKFTDKQNNKLNYQKVISTGNGNYYVLANQEKCDIYNFNNEIVLQIVFSKYDLKKLGMNQILLYSNQQDWFFYLIDDKKQVSLQIQNISSQQQIIPKSKRNQLQKSNPYFDLIKGSVIKYGPTINLNDSSWVQTQHYANQQVYQKLYGYFNIIEFEQTDELISTQNIYDINGYFIQTKQIIFYLISRISIQLCTIEKSLLIPLCNGLQIKDVGSKQNQIRILQKTEQIEFGILEKLLSYKNQNLFIISIMGRQSSGKSYLLNRIFGTRFGVSSARCTDGIWMGVSLLNDTIFILFDCEGLFSSRRTYDEETMLLSFLSSISDITILNQDLSFNRNLNSLFNNLSQSMEQVNLMIAVRDVNQKEKAGAEKELMKNIELIKNNQQTGSFLDKLFNNQFSIIMMSYFETKSFDKDIKELRKKFQDQSSYQKKRWDNQYQLLRSMKIMLVQLEVKDHRSLEDLELEYSVKILEKKACDLWYYFKQDTIEFIVFDDPQNTFINLIQFLENKLGRSQSTLNHNKYLLDYSSQLQGLLNKRKNIIIDLLQKESLDQNIEEIQIISSILINKEKMQRVKQDIKQYLDDQSQFYQICQEKCGQCFLYCKERKNHISNEILKNYDKLEEELQFLQQQIQDLIKDIQGKDSEEMMSQKIEQNKLSYQQLDEVEQYLINQQTLINETQKLQDFFSLKQFEIKDFNEYFLLYVQNQLKTMEHWDIEEQSEIKLQTIQVQDQIIKKMESIIYHDDDDQNFITSESQEQSEKSFIDSKKPYQFNAKLVGFKKNQSKTRNQIIEDYEKELKKKIEYLKQKVKHLSNSLLQNDNILKQKEICQEKIIQLENQKQNFHYITNLYEDVLKLSAYLADQHKKQSESNLNLEVVQNQRWHYLNEIKQLQEQIGLNKQLKVLQSTKVSKQNEINIFKEMLIQKHSCGRKFHQCDQICEGCQIPGTYCKQLAGHTIDNKYHLCSKETHFCKKNCAINGCQSFCQHRLDHSEDLQHDCLQKHQCLEQCQFCSNICEENVRIQHTIHQCKIRVCQKECFFCSNYSKPEKKCQNNCQFKHNEVHPIHICKKPHNCPSKCEKPGICQIGTYTEETKQWTTQNGAKFPYKVYKQNIETYCCYQHIEVGQISHAGQHSCNEESHICGQRCPECESICTKQFGHEGKHNPHQHRNKDCQIFTLLEGMSNQKLVIKEQGEVEREFQVLESCEPETCTRSCNRRSRAHFHLLKCEGDQNCAEIKLNKIGKKVAKHQNQKYQGSHSIYDEILCEYYWEYLGWKSPVERKDKWENSLCNYYCNACGDKDKKYCTQEAWHTDSDNYADHNFSCRSQHKDIDGVDVQFVIDTTESMEDYIEMVKETVYRLILATKPFLKNNPDGILFSVISYKDHCDSPVVKSQNFCKSEEALTFLETLKAFGGGDYPEAMLDGLHEGAKQSWRNNSNKLLFLIADSPPHGRLKFHNQEDNYPLGCPCGLNEKDVLQSLKIKNIEMVILKLNENLNQTIAVFKRIWNSIIALEQISNEEFIKKIEQLVCKQLEIKEITLSKG